MPTDPRTLESLADELDAKADELEAEVVKLRRAAAELRGKALTIGHERSKLGDTVQASAYVPHAKKSGRPVETDHPFAKALASQKPPISVRQWAEAHRLTRAKVTSWMLDGDGGRRIPAKYADEILKDFKVPKSAWRNGIRED